MNQFKNKKANNMIRQIISLLVFTALTFSFAGTVFAQKETAPAGGPPKPFVFPAAETFTLKNGMKVTLVPYGSVPKVQIVAQIRAGSLNEEKSERWISEIVAAMLKEGTTTRSSEVIARETAEMGGNFFTAAQTDKTIVGGEVLTEFDTRFLSLMADVILNPKFTAEDLETIRANKSRELTLSKAQAGSIAIEKFRQVIYPDHPYGEVFATEEAIKNYSLDGVKKFYHEQYGAARTHLYVVGQFNGPQVKKTVETLFGGWKRGADAVRNVPAAQTKRSLSVIDRPGAPQSTIYLGMPAIAPSDPDFIKFSVMNNLLGGSFGSRITSNIRENKGYTYSPNSTLFNRYKTGFWYEAADVTTAHTGDSIKEILFEINRLRTEAPSDVELQGIKNYMIGIYVLQNSSRTGVANQLEMMNYNELDKSYLDSYIANINAVTAQDVQMIVQKYLTEEKMTIVVVGDRSKIDEQLKPYGK